MKRLRVMYVGNTAASLYVFRRPLITRLVNAGHEVFCVCPPGDGVHKLSELGALYIPAEMSRHGTAIAENARAVMSLTRVIKTHRPHIVHAFAHKPIVLVGLAGILVGKAKYFCTVTGLGTIFTHSGIRYWMLRAALVVSYSLVLTRFSNCFFQNRDDRNFFIRWRLARKKRTTLTFGSGVEPERIRSLTADQAMQAREDVDFFGSSRDGVERFKGDPLRVLLVARPVADKGVREFYGAAAWFQQNNPKKFSFSHAGTFSENDDLFDWVNKEGRESSVTQLGFVSDMYGLYDQVDVVVLPSYREGSSMALAEACARGKVLLAADVAGCRNAVIDGWNGFLFKPRSTEALIDALARVQSLDFEKAKKKSINLAMQ